MLREQNSRIQRIGIIGTGRVADRFIPEAKLVSGVSTQGVYNPHIESAQQFADQWKIEAYDSLEKFFDSVDIVYIASPHATHYEYMKAALEHGKHVLCEKPLTLNRAQTVEVFRDAKKRELTDRASGGSFTELGSYVLLPVLKLFGDAYEDLRFDVIRADNGLDIFTKASLRYPNGIATATCGLGVKSDGRLLIAGTKGYILAEAPWWKTTYFEVHYENPMEVEKYTERFLGEGLRYEISDFVSMINGGNSDGFKLTRSESVALSGIMERFLSTENRGG